MVLYMYMYINEIVMRGILTHQGLANFDLNILLNIAAYTSHQSDSLKSEHYNYMT